VDVQVKHISGEESSPDLAGGSRWFRSKWDGEGPLKPFCQESLGRVSRKENGYFYSQVCFRTQNAVEERVG